jgi:hypothetical protein
MANIPLLQPATKTDVDVDTRIDERTTDDGDHEKLAHIVLPKSAVTEAYITGTPVTALCGKSWVPTRDPGRYPVCETCKEILNDARARQGKPPI